MLFRAKYLMLICVDLVDRIIEKYEKRNVP